MSDTNNPTGMGKRIVHILKSFVLKIPFMLSNNKLIIGIIAFLYFLPLTTTASTSPIRSLLFLITQIMIFGLLAMSFDLQLGRAGLLNFGQVALFGVGAYFMAFTLNSSILPAPFNQIALIPYPITIIFAALVGASLGFLMGLTTSRMRGTSFAFIALAIAMFIYNFFSQNPSISGGETGLNVTIPGIIRSAPFYMVFVVLAFVSFATFLGMMILYVRKRIDTMGLILFIPVVVTLTGFLLAFGGNIIGPMITFFSLLGIIVLYLIERYNAITDPLRYANTPVSSGKSSRTNSLFVYILPLAIVILGLVGLLVTFGSNILQMIDVWIQQSNTFYFTIPVQYYLTLTSVVAVYLFVRRLVESPFGRMVVAVAQNEQRAEALGYNSYHCKLIVLVISGAIAGLAGALFTPVIRTINPESALGVNITINAMLYTIIGGIGTLLGPLLGTGVVVYSQQNLVVFIQDVLNLPGQLWLVALGIIYIFIVLFMPFGIVGTLRQKSLPLKEKLTQLKIRRFEFGIRETDYWIFALIGAIGLFVMLLIASL